MLKSLRIAAFTCASVMPKVAERKPSTLAVAVSPLGAAPSGAAAEGVSAGFGAVLGAGLLWANAGPATRPASRTARAARRIGSGIGTLVGDGGERLPAAHRHEMGVGERDEAALAPVEEGLVRERVELRLVDDAEPRERRVGAVPGAQLGAILGEEALRLDRLGEGLGDLVLALELDAELERVLGRRARLAGLEEGLRRLLGGIGIGRLVDR